MKQVGRINLEPQPGYPKITATEDSYTLVVRYACTTTQVRGLPKVGSAWTRGFTVPNGLGKLVLSDLKVESMKGEDGPWMAELTYTPEALYDEVNGDIFTTYELVTEDMDVPIEQHPDFRTRWKYSLIYRKEKGKNNSFAAAAFWPVATSPSIVSSDGDPGVAWILPGDQLPGKDWRVFGVAEKHGVDSYRAGVAKVRMVRTCPRRGPLEAEARSVDYKISTPKVTFGLAGKWLRGGSSIRRNGRKWELTVEYINSLDIDTDIYKQA